MRMVANIVLFQIAWLACVLGAAHGLVWPGVLAALVACAVHVVDSQRPISAVAAIAAVAILGVIAETALMVTGLVSYAAPWPAEWAAPVWLVAMWAAFATLPDRALSFLRKRPAVAAALGALAGPLAYLAGARLGAMQLETPILWPLAAIAMMWCLAMPLIMWIADRARADFTRA